MKKVGLVMAHGVTNYGALLQSYAMQQVVESLGFETEIIDYKSLKYKRRIKFDLGLIAFFWNKFKDAKKKKSVQRILDEPHIKNRERRLKEKQLFEASMLKNIHTYVGAESLHNASKSCYAVLIGSDQMWLPGVNFGYYQSLRFVDKNTRRISYATSLGVSEYPKAYHRSARDMWKNIDFLSVREEKGAEIIKSICGDIPVNVVTDPTYLLTKEVWEKRIPIKKMANEPYVLCYFLGNSEDQMKQAAEYAKNHNVKCYTILSDESENSIDMSFADKVIVGASVSDFVNWIRGAECVITDSFHGLAFSVINEKQFFIYYRKRDESTTNRNSRIDNILKMWDLKERLIENNKKPIPDIPLIDYNKVNTLVSDKRKASMQFLQEALQEAK